MCVRMYVCMCMCVCVCVYVYVCICVCCVYVNNLFDCPLTLNSDEFVDIQVAPKPVSGMELITCQGAETGDPYNQGSASAKALPARSR